MPNTLASAGSNVNEWVNGRAGTLYLLRLMRTWVPGSASLIDPAINQLIDCILGNGPPFIFHGWQYLSIGHGEMGILTQIVLSSPSRAEKLTAWPEDLLGRHLESGTWPADNREASRNLVQLCHGAPGFALSLQHIRPYFLTLHDRIDSALIKARDITWKEGILKKPNLCHGVTGNALAFPPDEKREHFLACGTAERTKESEEGLWEKSDYEFEWCLGFASPGRAWGFMVMNDEQGRFICYNDV